MQTVFFSSLGCARNQVDSEVMLGSLKKHGFKIKDTVGERTDVYVINTCAFVESAREESVDAILEAAELKKKGRIRYLVIAGCLPQLYRDKLTAEIPEADLVIGTSDFPKIADMLGRLAGRTADTHVSRRLDYLYDEASPRFLLTPRHYAYVKISEGCSNFCSYCIISHLRGPFRSRSIKSVTAEIKKLSSKGKLREIDLIGQDTTLFGIDRYGKTMLPCLLERICGLKGSIEWVRILYTHPAHYTEDLIKMIRDEKKICKYLDLPIQHISDKILKNMNRRIQKKDIIKLIDKLRKMIPGIALRTSVIVGFPGETDKDFKELLNFLRKTRFDRLGAFMYSKESDTPASRLECQIPQRVKKDRMDEVMKLQKGVSLDINKSFLGRRIRVLIDEKTNDGNNSYIGRSERDAPEGDGLVYVKGKSLKTGEFYNVKITDTLEYDLAGEVS